MGRKAKPLSTQVEYWAADKLVIPSWNTQQHDEENIRTIKRSIKEFGYCDYLVVRRSDGLVIGGAGRLMALRRLWAEGWREVPPDAVPVVTLECDDITAKKLSLALNRIQSETDTVRLTALLQDLVQAGETLETLSVTGYTPLEITQYLETIVESLNDSTSHAVVSEVIHGLEKQERSKKQKEETTLFVERRFMIPYSLLWDVDNLVTKVMKVFGKGKKALGLALAAIVKVAAMVDDANLWETAIREVSAAVQEEEPLVADTADEDAEVEEIGEGDEQ